VGVLYCQVQNGYEKNRSNGILILVICTIHLSSSSGAPLRLLPLERPNARTEDSKARWIARKNKNIWGDRTQRDTRLGRGKERAGVKRQCSCERKTEGRNILIRGNRGIDRKKGEKGSNKSDLVKGEFNSILLKIVDRQQHLCQVRQQVYYQ